MPGARDHTELDVWKLSDELQGRVKEVVNRPVFARDPKLREQLKDAAESPCPNIAEGFGRYYPRDNARFVRIAIGSLTEIGEHLRSAKAGHLISSEEEASLASLARRARGAAKRYASYLQSAKAPHTD